MSDRHGKCAALVITSRDGTVFNFAERPKRRRITDAYVAEKVEAYNVAIDALEAHEPGSDGDKSLSRDLRDRLANHLVNEIETWLIRTLK